MDYVEWCERMLATMNDLTRQLPDRQTIGVAPSEVARAMFPSEMADGTPLLGPLLICISTALKNLENVGLVEASPLPPQFRGHVAPYYKVTRDGRQHVANPTLLWAVIGAQSLEPQEEQVLSTVNRLSPTDTDGHPMLEYLKADVLESAGTSNSIDAVITDLNELGLVSILGDWMIGVAATYRGLVWEAQQHHRTRNKMTKETTDQIELSPAEITQLLSQIQRMQEIMEEVATGHASIQHRDEEYKRLYREVERALRDFGSRGVPASNSNTFRSLWDWYGYWRDNLPTYQDRRQYVRHLYDEIERPFQEVLEQIEATTEDDTSPSVSELLKHALAARTSESLTIAEPALQESLRQFRKDHPDARKVGFIMMRFGSTKAHKEITDAIRATLATHGIEGLRADDKQYHDDLFPNVQTYMEGCGFGIAVFERIEAEDFNPNVALELGYMIAKGKPVCLLKDATLRTLHADLVGKLYRTFNPQDVSATIEPELTNWLRDKGLIS